MTEFLDALHQPHAQLLLRLVLGGLLLLAGITKLAEHSAAHQAVSEYDVLPERFVRRTMRRSTRRVTRRKALCVYLPTVSKLNCSRKPAMISRAAKNRSTSCFSKSTP